MRIALVYDRLYPEVKGGVERRVWELATRLADRGNEVHLLVPRFWGHGNEVTRRGVVLRGVSMARKMYSAKGRRSVLPSLAHALGVWKVLRAEHFDVVDCQIPAHPAAIAAATASPSSRSGLVLTWHEAWGRDWVDEMGILGHVGRLVERCVARLPGLHVAVSDHVAGALEDVGGRASAVIPPGVDLGELDVETGRPGVVSDVLFVGRLIPIKNLGLLIEATEILVRNGHSLRVVVIGEGSAEQMWRAKVIQLGLAANFEFVAPFDEWEGILAALRSTKILALPSLREGFGMIALEAAACSVPVVTVDHRRNAASRFVDHEITGLHAPDSPAEFAAAIERLLTDARLRNRLGSQAKHKAERFNWESVVDTTLTMYSDRIIDI